MKRAIAELACITTAVFGLVVLVGAWLAGPCPQGSAAGPAGVAGRRAPLPAAPDGGARLATAPHRPAPRKPVPTRTRPAASPHAKTPDPGPDPKAAAPGPAGVPETSAVDAAADAESVEGAALENTLAGLAAHCGLDDGQRDAVRGLLRATVAPDAAEGADPATGARTQPDPLPARLARLRRDVESLLTQDQAELFRSWRAGGNDLGEGTLVVSGTIEPVDAP